MPSIIAAGGAAPATIAADLMVDAFAQLGRRIQDQAYARSARRSSA